MPAFSPSPSLLDRTLSLLLANKLSKQSAHFHQPAHTCWCEQLPAISYNAPLRCGGAKRQVSTTETSLHLQVPLCACVWWFALQLNSLWNSLKCQSLHHHPSPWWMILLHFTFLWLTGNMCKGSIQRDKLKRLFSGHLSTYFRFPGVWAYLLHTNLEWYVVPLRLQ